MSRGRSCGSMAVSPSSDAQEIAVVGAGIVGCATALWLARDGHRVTLIDRKAPGEETSHGNGGVLAAAGMVPVTTPGLIRKAPRMLVSRDEPLYLRWGYLPRLLPWLVRYLSHANAAETERIAAALAPIIGDSLNDHLALAEGTDAARYIHPCDYLYLYRDRAAYRADGFAWDLRARHGIAREELEGEALRAYDPAFAPDQRLAIRLPGHGRISDPGAYTRALAAEVERRGGRILRATLRGIVRENGAVTGLRLDGETLPCRRVILATGVWSKEIARPLGLSIPMESERGYHLDLWEPSRMPRAPVMIAAAKFVATPMEGRLRLAGIVEFGGLSRGPSRAPFAYLERMAKRALPGLTWARADEWMGHRPAPSDSIPLIGPVPGLQGAFVAAGHHHVGLTGSARTGRLIARLATGRAPNLDMTPYDPARFATPD